jgi:hypothetical protein
MEKGAAMIFMSTYELHSSAEKLKQAVEKEGFVVVTNNGNLSYVVVGVNEDNFEETIQGLGEMRAQRKGS